MTSSRSRLLLFAGLAGLLFVLAACVRFGMRKAGTSAPTEVKRTPIAGVGAARLAPARPDERSHRIVLNAAAVERLQDAARRDSPAFRRVRARAEEALGKRVDSGYQGFEWAEAIANLSLAWHATGDERYATAALGYLNALLEDRNRIGDGRGGATVVRHDSGYGIRTFGAYSALGYDWLRGAPGFDQALQKRVITRLGEWLGWYRESGYLRDRPIANYYWGYLTALSFAGLATAGDTAEGDAWLALAQKELTERALPALRDELAGGGWPEGWQYGEYTTAEVALVLEGFRTGAGIELARHVPWLAENITHHVHALLPDQTSVYDGGTWGERPARPSALGLAATAVALDGIGDSRAAEARWLMAHALPPLQREQAFVGLLAERPGAPERSPRNPEKTSLHLLGQGLTFARSDWSPGATWISFQAGARIAEDHQHNDQGHFELARGADLLLIDAGNSEGSATINHNTLLIDDGGRILTYPPNQGVWGGKRVKTTRSGDDGSVLAAVGDFAEAYAPVCARDGCSKRAVKKAVRSLVYVRPSLLVIDDRVTVENADTAVTWAAHLTQNPKLEGDLASAVIGRSRVDVRTLEPRDAARRAPREPTPSGQGPHRANSPWGASFRLEIDSPRGSEERGFLHFISAADANEPPPAARPLSG
ncbi:MAG TPA: heparinase II/III family protein, partial [Polyangiaceae bacterium]